MKLNCIDNLKNCDAKCCKQLKFFLPIITEKIKYYYHIHGCKVEQLPDRSWVIIVPMVCPELKDNKCSLHGLETKPEVCNEYGHTFNKLGFPKECIYPIKHGS